RVEAVVDPRPELLGELRGTGEAEAVELGAGLEPAGGMGAGDPAGADDADAQGGRGVRVGQVRSLRRWSGGHEGSFDTNRRGAALLRSAELRVDRGEDVRGRLLDGDPVVQQLEGLPVEDPLDVPRADRGRTRGLHSEVIGEVRDEV